MMLIENKPIRVDNTSYRMSIERIPLRGGKKRYTVYISDTNSPFTTEIKFNNLFVLHDELQSRIREHHKFNSEKYVIGLIDEWDGVIEV